jgi:hypothetical protein
MELTGLTVAPDTLEGSRSDRPGLSVALGRPLLARGTYDWGLPGTRLSGLGQSLGFFAP